MATYRVTAPDGSVYNVTPPEGANVAPDQILAQVQSQHQAPAPTDPYANKSPEEIAKQYRQAKLLDAGDAVLGNLSDAYVRREEQTASPLGRFGLGVDDAIRTAARGVPIIGGALDEANAGLSSLMGGNYSEALDYQRARDRRADKVPGSTAVQLAGGVAGTMAGMSALGVPLGVGSKIPLAQRALFGAAVGAPVGAADMFARGEGGVENRAMNAAAGGAIGAATGAAAPVVGSVVGAGAQRLADYLTSDAAIARLGINRQTANVLLRQLGIDDTLTGAGSLRIAAAGPNSMVADAGPAASNLLDTALQRSGPGATAARQAIEQRATNANLGFENTLNQTLGAPLGVETRQAAIRTGSAAARGAAYDAAYARPIDYASQTGQDLQSLFKRIPGEAWGYANKLMKLAGDKSKQIAVDVADDGSVTLKTLPDVRQLDYVKRALDAAATSGEGQGALGGQTAMGRAFQNLSGDLRNTLKQAVPEYGQALDTAADPISRVKATEFGSDLLSPKVTREQVATKMANMGGAERRSAMSGLRDAIDEITANVRSVASDPNMDARQLRAGLDRLSSDAVRQKIAYVIGQAKADQFFRQVGQLSKAMELRASVTRGSQTFARASADAQVQAQTRPGALGLLLEGRPVQALQKGIQHVTGRTPEQVLAQQDQIYGQIADALTRVRGPQAQQFLRNLQAAINARSASNRFGNAAGTLGGYAAAGTAPGAVNLLQQAATQPYAP